MNTYPVYNSDDHDEHDDEDLNFGRFRPLRARGLPNKRNDRKGQYQYTDWDED